MKQTITQKPSRGVLLISFSTILTVLIYVWLISFGSWTRWKTLSNSYEQLASAFDKGKLYLDTKPDPALLALANPYDPSARAGINAINDASLYNGKYYLYFGPAPALPLAILKFLGLGQIGDQYLVFAFILGIAFIQALLMIKIWRHFFHDMSISIIAICILLGGLITPFASMLTKARVYEAAIASGQFFFLAGYYFIFTALENQTTSDKHLMLGGTSLALAIGSRLTQIVPVGFLIAMTAFWYLKKNYKHKSLLTIIKSINPVIIPVIVGVAILGWYNWARFGSVFETGIFYQLAWTDPQKNYHEFFSPLYILQNLYNYLIVPPKFKNLFPFLFAVSGKIHPVMSTISMPRIYNSEKITGLLYSAPFCLYAIIPIINLVRVPGKQSTKPDDQKDQSLFYWMLGSLLGSFLVSFVTFLAFFWAALRYFEDFLPSLFLLSVVGFWQGYHHYAKRPIHRSVYLALGIALIVISILASSLIGLSYGSPRFEEFNPHLWNFLQR